MYKIEINEEKYYLLKAGIYDLKVKIVLVKKIENEKYYIFSKNEELKEEWTLYNSFEEYKEGLAYFLDWMLRGGFILDLIPIKNIKIINGMIEHNREINLDNSMYGLKMISCKEMTEEEYDSQMQEIRAEFKEFKKKIKKVKYCIFNNITQKFEIL